MKKAKTTKHALLMSVLSMMLCCAMLVSSTFAWFTDSVTSGNNRIVAGNLDVEVTHTNDQKTEDLKNAGTLFPVELWEPGVVSYETFTVTNKGTLAFDYEFNFTAKDFNKVVLADGTATNYTLKDVIKIGVIEGTAEGKTRQQLVDAVNAVEETAGSVERRFAPFADFQYTDYMQAEDKDGSNAQSEKTFTVVAYWEPNVLNDDDYNVNNGKTVSKLNGEEKQLYIDIVVDVQAKQRVYEDDSFNNQYDAGTMFPYTVYSQVVADTKTELVAVDTPVSVTIPENQVEADTTLMLIVTLESKAHKNTVVTAGSQVACYDIKVVDADTMEAYDGDVTYTIKLDVGKDLENVRVFHNGEAVAGAVYNPASGIVTFTTNSFSQFDVTYQESWNRFAAESYATPVDSANKIVTIASAEELALFAKEVNSGNTYRNYTVKLTSDIDLGQHSWNPIGDFLRGAYFDGNFDGQGHTIKNLNCESYMAGLFGQSTWLPEGPKQMIKNFTVENAKIVSDNKCDQGGWSAAVVYAEAGPQTDFENIIVKGDIVITADVASYYMGAIVGGRKWYGSMNNCHVYANEGSYVECKGISALNYTAGLAAWHGEGTKVVIKDSSSNIDVKGAYATAGLLGVAQYGNIVENCTVGLNEDGTMRRVNISRIITSGDNQDENDIGGIVGMITDDDPKQNVCIRDCTGMVHFDVDFGKINHDGVIGNNYRGNESANIVVENCNIDWTKRQ